MPVPQHVAEAIAAELASLPPKFRKREAVAMLIAIGLQESRFTHRFQVLTGRPGVKGPARGYWQFERGGGVVGVLKHPASSAYVRGLAAHETWINLETDDRLAVRFARLLLWTDSRPCPAVTPENAEEAWVMYIHNWRPGKPHRKTWDAFWQEAVEWTDKHYPAG